MTDNAYTKRFSKWTYSEGPPEIDGADFAPTDEQAKQIERRTAELKKDRESVDNSVEEVDKPEHSTN